MPYTNTVISEQNHSYHRTNHPCESRPWPYLPQYSHPHDIKAIKCHNLIIMSRSWHVFCHKRYHDIQAWVYINKKQSLKFQRIFFPRWLWRKLYQKALDILVKDSKCIKHQRVALEQVWNIHFLKYGRVCAMKIYTFISGKDIRICAFCRLVWPHHWKCTVPLSLSLYLSED